MKQWRFDYQEAKIPKLGFGLMRLPVDDSGEINIEEVARMADYYMANGMNYFDTAYMYHAGMSERAFKEAILKRFPRESYFLADKLPIWEVGETSDGIEKLFKVQQERTGAEYFDFYLLHSLSADHNEKCERLGAYEFVSQLKKDGRAKHIGFSFHGDYKTLEKILSEHPEMEFVQLQINYLDWDTESRDFYELAVKYNTPIIVMEPVRGGTLAKPPANVEELLKKANPDASIASWAIRYCLEFDGIMTILSGMSNMEQLTENVELIKQNKPLTASEKATVEEAARLIKDTPTVPCTDCKYCSDCPQEIPIFDIFACYNDHYVMRKPFGFGTFIGKYKAIEESKRGDKCIGCNLCVSVCPQRIDIPEKLEAIAKLVD